MVFAVKKSAFLSEILRGEKSEKNRNLTGVKFSRGWRESGETKVFHRFWIKIRGSSSVIPILIPTKK